MNFGPLLKEFEGEFFTDETTRRLYATDASAYREMPAAVCMPRSARDIEVLIRFAQQNKTSLIPRTAGTSLAGQVVGAGIVVLHRVTVYVSAGSLGRLESALL